MPETKETKPYVWVSADHVVGPMPLIAVDPDTGIALDPQPEQPERPAPPAPPEPEQPAAKSSKSS